MPFTAPMNPEIKALWVQWLRDNVDKQGDGALNRDGKFCCLGGLCELAVAAGVARYFPSAAIATLSFYGPIDGEPNEVGNGGWTESLLPAVVSEWAGLGLIDNPVVRATSPEGNEREASLTELNDEWQRDFNQIADLIEQQL